jgi:exonuclease VII small subunit
MKPIGYYLKLADNLLSKRIDAIHLQHQINRIEWQVINSISEKKTIAKLELIELMKPFADIQTLENSIDKLEIRKLINNNNSNLALSNEGQQFYKTCFETQQDFRKKVMTGISDANYQTTISTLQQIINNLENGK